MKKWIFCLSLLFLPAVSVAAETTMDGSVLVGRKDVVFWDDLSQMRRRRLIRVLVSFNRTYYFINEGQPAGFETDLFQEYEKFLNQGVDRDEFKVHIVFIPVPFNELISALEKGKGDIAAAGLTITPEREKKVAFTDPYLPRVKEVVVMHKEADPLASLEDLAGKQIHLLAESSHIEHLKELNDQFKNKGLPDIDIDLVEPQLQAADILERVNAGEIPFTVIDNHEARYWLRTLKNLFIREDLVIHEGRQIGWAVRKDNPELKAHLDQFIKQYTTYSR